MATLKTSASTINSVATGGSGGAPSGAAGGDLAGTYPNPTVPGKQSYLTPTAVKTGAYTAAASDLVLCDPSAGSFTVTLPSAPADKTQVAVKIVIAPGVNTVSVTCGGTDKFNSAVGATTAALSLLGHSLVMQYQASTGLWFTVADDLPLPQLDTRFATPVYATSRAVALSIVLGG